MEKKYSSFIELHLLRHGQTQDNITGTLAGHQSGKLTQQGVKQAKLTGKRLKAQKFDYVYVSDLGRTKDTFKNVSEQTEFLKTMQPFYTPLLREKSGGILQGQPIKLWKENADKQGLDIRKYKCQKGQSWEDVQQRGYKFIELLVKNHLIQEETKELEKAMNAMSIHNKQNQNKERTKILAVSHGGYIMEMHNICNLIEKNQPSVYNNSAKNCSFHVFKIQYDGKEAEVDRKKLKMKCLVNNDAAHII